MDRREFLTAGSSAFALTLAGCTSSDDEPDDGGGGRSQGDPEPATSPDEQTGEQSDDGTSGNDDGEEPDTDDEDGSEQEPQGPPAAENTALPTISDVEVPYYDGTATTIEGSGATVTESFQGDLGPIVLDYEHSGSSNFIVELWDEDLGERAAIPVNEIGAVDGMVAVPVPASTYSLDVDADGAWSVTVAHPFPDPELEAHHPPCHAGGEGSTVVGPVMIDGSVTVTGEHEGESNFIVRLMNDDAESSFDQTIVFNEIGTFEGETRVRHDGLALVAVEAGGAWRLKFE